MAKSLRLAVERPDNSVLDQVVLAVRQAIAAGDLAPGRRLTERELMELTGVSRPSIREAVQRLQTLGLMETAPSRGFRVAVLGRAEVQHIYEVREILEPTVVELFTMRAPDEEVAKLAQYVVDPESDLEKRLEAIWCFDEILRAGCGNPLLQSMLEPLHARIHALRRMSALTIEGRKLASTQEYGELEAAIRERSPERAALASRQHIQSAAAAALAAIAAVDASPGVVNGLPV